MAAARGKPKPFPWDQVMRFGLGALRLSPRDFWASTPLEIAAALRGVYGDTLEPLERLALEALLERFPD